MSEHFASKHPGIRRSSVQHLICVKGAIQHSGQMDSRQCQSNPSHPLVIQTMPVAAFAAELYGAVATELAVLKSSLRLATRPKATAGAAEDQRRKAGQQGPTSCDASRDISSNCGIRSQGSIFSADSSAGPPAAPAVASGRGLSN